MPLTIDRIGVIGGGAWGTALAQTLTLAGRDVVLWAREAETVSDIATRHVNRAPSRRRWRRIRVPGSR